MKKTGIFAALLFVLVSGLVGCLPEGGGNKITFNVSAVVSEGRTGEKYLITVDGEKIAVPTLSSEFKAGDGVYAHIEIDYDHQPSKDYYTASFVSCLSIDKGTLSMVPEFEIANDTFPIISLSISRPNTVLNGYLFFFMGFQAAIRQDLEYKLVVEKEDTERVAYNAYLVANKVNAPTDATILFIEHPAVINLHSAIEELGKDTVLYGEFNVKQLRLNLKYFAGMNEEHLPIYRDYDEQIVIAIDR